jgi:hypothetical protein
VTSDSAKRPFSALLKEGRLPERTVDICLRGDLVAEFEMVDAALTEAMRRPVDSKEGSGTAELVQRIEAIQAEMKASTHTFRIRALDRAAFRELQNAHPPREGDGPDEQVGFDRSTFFTALLIDTTYDPVLTAEEWDELLGKLTERQYGDLTDAAWFSNRDAVSIPFSKAALLARRNTAEE